MTLERQPSGDADRDPEVEAAERNAREELNIGPRIRRFRRLWRMLPGSPRCKMCNGPFGGVGGGISTLLGKGRWPANPKYCRFCFKDLYQHRAGAEIDCSLMFADVRGSTGLAEGMRPQEYRALIDRFYASAQGVLMDHDAIVDKFVGDEVIAIFIPALAGELHARRAIDAGLAVRRATGHGTDAPWIPSAQA